MCINIIALLYILKLLEFKIAFWKMKLSNCVLERMYFYQDEKPVSSRYAKLIYLGCLILLLLSYWQLPRI